MHGPVGAPFPEQVAQVLPEKHGRPAVRENEADVLYVRREIMGRDLFQKWCHATKIYFPSAKTLHNQKIFSQRYIFSGAVANEREIVYLCN
jgi:hypothetical protein